MPVLGLPAVYKFSILADAKNALGSVTKFVYCNGDLKIPVIIIMINLWSRRQKIRHFDIVKNVEIDIREIKLSLLLALTIQYIHMYSIYASF